MGFSKDKNSKGIDIVVTHPWHPGAQFVFPFPKTLPQSALEAEKTFLGLQDDARADEHRKALINTVAEMLTEEPAGFDDFPGAGHQARIAALRAQLETAAAGVKPEGFDPEVAETEVRMLSEKLKALDRETPLAERVRVYFDDPEQPELEAITVSAWRAYRAAALPSAYLKSAEGRSA